MPSNEGMGAPSLAPAFNYPEPTSPIWCRLGRRGRRNRERRVDQVANRPRAICDAECYGRRRVQRFMHAAPVVMGDVKAPLGLGQPVFRDFLLRAIALDDQRSTLERCSMRFNFLTPKRFILIGDRRSPAWEAGR
jgi:hypothetical protein